jgi:hypothetical protein
VTTTRAELQADIYEILSKSPTAYGLLTPTKVNKAIQDSLDYIAAKMMKIGGGWLGRVSYEDITADDHYVDIPAGMAILNFVKRKNGNGDYEELAFDDGSKGTTVVSTTNSLTVGTYRFSSGRLYLNQKPATAVTDGILFDGTYYPDRLTADGSEIDGDMNNMTFLHYAKWRSASQLFGLTSKETPPWTASEIEWKQAALEQIARRFREPTFIRNFNDY